jgi:hypothetical protein
MAVRLTFFVLFFDLRGAIFLSAISEESLLPGT